VVLVILGDQAAQIVSRGDEVVEVLLPTILPCVDPVGSSSDQLFRVGLLQCSQDDIVSFFLGRDTIAKIEPGNDIVALGGQVIFRRAEKSC